MQDEAGAIRMQAEAELVSPLVRVAVPSLSAAVFLHKQSDAQLPSDSSPVMQMAIKPADMSAGDAHGLMSAGRGEVSVLEEVLQHVPSLMSGPSTSAESAMAATAKMHDTDHSSKCQLQRLVSKLEVKMDLAAAPIAAMGAARRGTQDNLTAPAAASGMSALARQASAALVSFAASAQQQVAETLARTRIVPAGDFAQAQAGAGEALYERAAEKEEEEEEEETRRQKGNRRNTWLPDGVILRSGSTAKYGFKEYKESGASAVDVLLTMTNILGFPVGIKTGKYVLQCYAPPVSTSPDELKLHPAMSITVKAVDERVRSRDELLITLTVTFDNHTRVGHNVLSPALLGKSLLILPEVDTARGDLTLLSKGIRTLLESQGAIMEGIQLPAMQKAPVILIVDLLRSIQVSESAGQLVIDLSLAIRFPGASLLIPFKVPSLGLKLIDEDGAVRTDVNLKVEIEFSGITVDLKTTVKEAATRCNKLLSSVAFNAAAKLAGNVSVGTVLDAFPVILDMAPGLWVQQSSLDYASAAVAATHAHDSSNWCGFTGIQVSGARLCNYQNRSLEATVSNVMAMLSDKAAANAPLTDRFVLLTSGQKFDGGECVALPAATSTSEYASTAAANASCAAHRKGGGGVQTLAIAYPEVMLGMICTCKAGVNKCPGALAHPLLTAACFDIALVWCQHSKRQGKAGKVATPPRAKGALGVSTPHRALLTCVLRLASSLLTCASSLLAYSLYRISHLLCFACGALSMPFPLPPSLLPFSVSVSFPLPLPLLTSGSLSVSLSLSLSGCRCLSASLSVCLSYPLLPPRARLTTNRAVLFRCLCIGINNLCACALQHHMRQNQMTGNVCRRQTLSSSVSSPDGSHSTRIPTHRCVTVIPGNQEAVSLSYMGLILFY